MQSAAVNPATLPPYLNLSAVQVREARPDEVDFCQRQLEAHHYLGRAAPVGERLWQIVEHAGEPLGVLLWCAAAKRLKPREDAIGWDARTRVERLKLVVQNSRFCLWRTQPNLASRVLGEAARVLPEQWQRVHGYTPLLAETFVDPAHFAGTCYRAAGWEQAGCSRGTRRVFVLHRLEEELDASGVAERPEGARPRGAASGRGALRRAGEDRRDVSLLGEDGEEAKPLARARRASWPELIPPPTTVAAVTPLILCTAARSFSSS